MSNLAGEIEAGGGTAEDVARALGFVPHNPLGVWWRRPSGEVVTLPPFLASIDACAAECERRGWALHLDNDRGVEAHVRTKRGNLYFACGGSLPRALCAAIIRAIESEAGDE